MYELITRIDTEVRRRAVYVADQKDQWRSHAKEMREDPAYKLLGDCDDWAQTALHWLALEGMSRKDLYRAVVISKGSRFPDHMIGIAFDGLYYRVVGDTFAPSSAVTLGKNGLIGSIANGHTIVGVSSLADGPVWQFRKGMKRRTNTANKAMEISPAALDDLCREEGFRAETYDDLQPHTRLRVGMPILGKLTIGYGHTGPRAFVGNRITELEAREILKLDLQTVYDAIYRFVKRQLTQNQFDALAMLVFNIGSGNFRKSTLLRYINQGKPNHLIQAEFRKWIKSKGKVLGGLVKRRNLEADKWGNNSDLETARFDVQAAPMSAEHEKIIHSKSIWGQIAQFLMGGLVLASELQEPAKELHDAGVGVGQEWLVMAAGAIVSASAVALFVRRVIQIKFEGSR